MTKAEPKIRQRYQPSDVSGEKADLEFIYRRKQEMADARTSEEKKWDKWDKQYEGYREDKVDWQSNIYVPTTNSIIESQLSEIIDQNMRPYITARGVEDKPKAVVMNACIDHSWEIGMGNVENYKMTKDAFVRGTSIGQEYYRQEKRMVQWVYGFDSKTGKEKWEEKEITDYEDCFLENISLNDFYVDEKARGFFPEPYPARDAIRRYVMDFDSFKNFFKGPIWDPMGNAKYVQPAQGDTNYYEFFKPPESLRKDKDIEVLWYWSVAPTPGRSNYHDHLIVVANDVMIKWGPNPYRHKRIPFVRQVDLLRTKQFYGKGEAELLESIQEEQNTLRQMVLDRNHLDIDKSFLVSNRETGLDDDSLMTSPHRIIEVDDPQNVKALEYGDTPRSVFLSLAELKEDAVRVTGQDDRMSAVHTPGTATEAAILKEATLKRLRTKLWLLRNLTLFNVASLRESNIRQYYTQPKVEKIIGDKATADYKRKLNDLYRTGKLRMQGTEPMELKYKTIKLEDKQFVINNQSNSLEVRKSKEPTFFEVTPDMITPLYGHFDAKITAVPSTPVSKPLQQEKVSMMYDRLIQNPTYDPGKLGDALLEAHDYDPDEFKAEASAEEKMGEAMIEKQMQIAEMENQEFVRNPDNLIPPTPMATQPHTELHIAFIKSPEIMSLPPDSPILANLVRHTQGELQAQQLRADSLNQVANSQLGGGGGSYKTPSGPTPPTRGNTAVPKRAEVQQGANQMMMGVKP